MYAVLGTRLGFCTTKVNVTVGVQTFLASMNKEDGGRVRPETSECIKAF
jgi:hypothetical protein